VTVSSVSFGHQSSTALGGVVSKSITLAHVGVMVIRTICLSQDCS
jgi:hypothetical protein